MQSGNRLFDDLARLAGGAAGAASGLREEVEMLMRDRVRRILDEMEIVRREEFEAVRAMARAARELQEAEDDIPARLRRIEAAVEESRTGLATLGERIADMERRIAGLESAIGSDQGKYDEDPGA
jgi:BMFP domain-containing protein YqiC